MIAIISSIDELLTLVNRGHRRFVCMTMEPVVYAQTGGVREEIQIDYVSRYVDRQVIQEVFEYPVPAAKKVMTELDSVLTAFLEQHYSFRVSAFTSTFGYCLVSVVSILEVWDRLFKVLGQQFERIVIVDSALSSWLPGRTKSEILREIVPGNVEFLESSIVQHSPRVSSGIKMRNTSTILWLLLRNRDILKFFLKSKKKRFPEQVHSSPDVILFDPIGEFESFRTSLLSTAISYSRLRQEFAGTTETFSLSTLDTEVQELLSSCSRNVAVACAQVWEFAKQLLPGYLQEARWFSEVLDKTPSKVGLFGNTPIIPDSVYSLLANILLQKGIQSVSLQHGGYDGDTIMPGFEDRFHVQSTTSTYITYGYDEADHRRCYPLCARLHIQPGGSIRVSSKNVHRKRTSVDILYVPNNYPGLDQRVDCLFDSELVASQLAIIDYLNTCGRTSLVKIRNAKNYQSAFLPVLEATAKNVKILWGIDATDLLTFIKPRVVVYEEPASTFLQSLQLDCEVFSLNRLFFHFEPVAYEMLKKRVHFFDSVHDMTAAVEQFFEGRIPAKRDNSYVEHYLRGPKELYDALHDVLNKSEYTLQAEI